MTGPPTPPLSAPKGGGACSLCSPWSIDHHLPLRGVSFSNDRIPPPITGDRHPSEGQIKGGGGGFCHKFALQGGIYPQRWGLSLQKIYPFVRQRRVLSLSAPHGGICPLIWGRGSVIIKKYPPEGQIKVGGGGLLSLSAPQGGIFP